MPSQIKKKGRKDVFNFGKHKGKTVGEVVDEDPTYICWVYENVSSFPIEREIYMDCYDAEEFDADQEGVESHYREMHF